MNLIQLTPFDLALTSSLIIALAVISHLIRLDIGKRLIIAALRTAVQLTLIGLVLKILFANVHLGWIVLMSLLMLAIAGREVLARLNRRFTGWWGYSIGTLSMSLSSFTVTMLALLVIIEPVPWYQPQYAIPLLGMMLGNTMTGVALSLDRLTQAAWDQRAAIEARLMLGDAAHQAIGDIRRSSISNGMIPTINSMAAAGIVSLPGMMTGQILSGTEPVEAVKYQILIMFLIAAGTGFGAICAVWLGSRRLFDDRDRLRLDRLQVSK
ncbi:MAG: iron export ABC transporter permease subunit FetB [Pseudomonadales bacterium]|nr:iron export ABC transporter permease subunit FetB [Pseudomonadales bacterium]MDP7357046.1 iron export ABC transporter permease subunit FetB [Pseudomonadales bacterium]MDP7597085.1 iron export ABC transporter permease subunit FetB [Pseudomonadales bacterium]HJN53216.1 iron export ABC transporter permease subunit FetB [Pseudomonadales bacterium]